MKLTAEKITKEFIRESGGTNRFTAVSETNFELSEGKVTVLSGRSGSGKTTLLNILSGLLPPTTGKVLLDGRDIYAMPDKKLSQLRNVSFGIIPLVCSDTQLLISSFVPLSNGAFQISAPYQDNVF